MTTDSPTQRWILTALNYLSDAQEHLGASVDDRSLADEVDQAKAILTDVLRKIPSPPAEQPPGEETDMLGYGFSPAQRCLMIAMSYLSDAQEHLGVSEDDTALVGEVNQAKVIIAAVQQKIPPGWADRPPYDDQERSP